MGFVSMLTSQHYALTFLGRTMVIGMMASVPLTLVTLPALLLLIERWRQNAIPMHCQVMNELLRQTRPS